LKLRVEKTAICGAQCALKLGLRGALFPAE